MWTIAGFADEIALDFETQCRFLKKVGIKHIDLRSAWGVNALDLTHEQLQEVSDLVSIYDLKVSTIASPVGKTCISQDWAEHREKYEVALDLARLFRAQYVRVFSFFVPPGDDPDDHRSETLARMQVLSDRAREASVTLLHENEKGTFGNIPRRCAEIVENAGTSNIKLIWDAANFVQCGIRPHTDGYSRLRGYIEYLHIKDASAASGAVVTIGEGDGQIAETIRALQEDGFDGYLSLEPHLRDAHNFGGFTGEQQFEAAFLALQNILRQEGIKFS